MYFGSPSKVYGLLAILLDFKETTFKGNLVLLSGMNILRKPSPTLFSRDSVAD